MPNVTPFESSAYLLLCYGCGHLEMYRETRKKLRRDAWLRMSVGAITDYLIVQHSRLELPWLPPCISLILGPLLDLLPVLPLLLLLPTLLLLLPLLLLLLSLPLYNNGIFTIEINYWGAYCKIGSR